MGLPGPDAGNGGKHLLLPPDYAGTIPDTGYYVHRASSNRQIIGARSLPVEGDVAAAKGRLTTIKVYPLNPTEDWTEPQWLDVTGKAQDTTPLQWETNLVFWEVLHQTVDSEPAYEGYRTNYGDLAALGIEKGRPFGPGPRMKSILEEAAQAANAQTAVGVGIAALRRRRLRHRRPRRPRSAREVVLPSHRGITRDVPPRHPGRFALLAWRTRRHGKLSRRRATYRLAVPMPVPAKLF
jgi:hypothetical protein